MVFVIQTISYICDSMYLVRDRKGISVVVHTILHGFYGDKNKHKRKEKILFHRIVVHN